MADANVASRCYWQRTVYRYFSPFVGDIPRGKDEDLSYAQAALLLTSMLHDVCTSPLDDYRAFVHFVHAHVRPVLLASLPHESDAWYLLNQAPSSDDEDVGVSCGHTLLATLKVGSSRGHFPLSVDFKEHPRVVAFLFNRIEQNSHLWFAIRPWLIGGSSLSGIFGTNHYDTEDSDVQPTTQLAIHLGRKRGEDFKDKKHLLRNGHTGEALGRLLCSKLTGLTVVERGTGVSLKNCAFSHSPDGIILDDNGVPCAMIEVKFHGPGSHLPSSYATCPPVYTPQCIQGMSIHRVPVCYFVSLFYRPWSLEGRYAVVTIEKLYSHPIIEERFYKALDAYTKDLRAGNPYLGPEFWLKRHEALESFSGQQREPLYAKYDGIERPITQLRIDLDLVIGEEARRYWARQPFYLTSEQVDAEHERKRRVKFWAAALQK